jgi:two-component system phosphate regulon sensor histidine kinase PhoR
MTTNFDAQAILQALPDGALIVDGAGMVVACNGHAEDIIQLRPVGLVAGSVIRSPEFAKALGAAAQASEAISVEVELRGRPIRQVQVTFARLRGGPHVLVLLRDFTREQAIEKMRRDFVANASHEMRTPLASIIGGVETLQGAARNDEKARGQFLETMLVQARRMKRLIDDLLTLSRIELNEHVRPNAQVSLLDIARQAKFNLAEAAEKAGVQVVLNGTIKGDVAGDADELLQVAQNLLENAIKYGAAGERVEMTCVQGNGHATLSVRDFGKGIAAIHLPRLTERFYRVSTQESRSRGGTGLGLAIVKHIVQRHRGNLDIHSEVGRGSTFSISIPLYKS